jgi:hypothetical protein
MSFLIKPLAIFTIGIATVTVIILTDEELKRDFKRAFGEAVQRIDEKLFSRSSSSENTREKQEENYEEDYLFYSNLEGYSECEKDVDSDCKREVKRDDSEKSEVKEEEYCVALSTLRDARDGYAEKEEESIAQDVEIVREVDETKVEDVREQEPLMEQEPTMNDTKLILSSTIPTQYLEIDPVPQEAQGEASIESDEEFSSIRISETASFEQEETGKSDTEFEMVESLL